MSGLIPMNTIERRWFLTETPRIPTPDWNIKETIQKRFEILSRYRRAFYQLLRSGVYSFELAFPTIIDSTR